MTTEELSKLTPEEKRIRIAEGVRIGRLTVIRKERQNRSYNWLWKCTCDCGGESVVLGSSLANGHTRSCGCLRADATRARLTVHGGARRGQHMREYYTWVGMRNRCYDSNNPAYVDYGSRGITVCERWKNSFANFLADMGFCPEGKTIDRKNNSLGYSPENCRWATATQQALNRRSNLLLTYNGKTQPASVWAKEIGLNRRIIYDRKKFGWSDERTLTVPPKQ